MIKNCQIDKLVAQANSQVIEQLFQTEYLKITKSIFIRIHDAYSEIEILIIREIYEE